MAAVQGALKLDAILWFLASTSRQALYVRVRNPSYFSVSAPVLFPSIAW